MVDQYGPSGGKGASACGWHQGGGRQRIPPAPAALIGARLRVLASLLLRLLVAIAHLQCCAPGLVVCMCVYARVHVRVCVCARRARA
eukprot:2937885-Prymnesium_polylepis.1